MLIPFSELFKKYNIKPDGILHLGANTGQEAEEYERLGINNVIWVEAIPEVHKQLEKNVKKYNHKTLCACISDRDDEEVKFNISNNESQSSSFLPFGVHLKAHPSVHYIDSITLQTIRVDTLLKKNNINLEGNWLLNADLQGVELQAFRSMGGLLNKFNWVYTELNSQETYVGCALVSEVDEYLKHYNFERVETADWVGNCWSDGLYIKKFSS